MSVIHVVTGQAENLLRAGAASHECGRSATQVANRAALVRWGGDGGGWRGGDFSGVAIGDWRWPNFFVIGLICMPATRDT